MAEFVGPLPEHLERARSLRALAAAFGATPEKLQIAKDPDRIRREILDALGDWPQRIYCPGGVKLFLDEGNAEVSEMKDSTDLMAVLKEHARVKFNRGQDGEGTNYVTADELYRGFGRAPEVREWLAVDTIPHEPAYPGHYVTWKPPAGYEPKGRYLAEFLGFCDSIESPLERAIFAAAVLTPFWGGPYNQRPLFFFRADQPASGKSEAAYAIARMASANLGAIMVNLDKRAEERLKERLLSPEGRRKNVAIVDNVKAAMDCALLEELVTAERISGKELAVGESSRPNTITWIVTANTPRAAGDLQSRSFAVYFKSLEEKDGEQKARWVERLHTFLADHGPKVVCDCLYLLKQRFDVSWLAQVKRERNPLWIRQVLGAVFASEAVMEVVGDVEILDVLAHNQAWRDESNQDLQEAQQFMHGLLERVVQWKDYRLAESSLAGPHLPTAGVFIRTEPPQRGADDADPFDDSNMRQARREAIAMQANNMVTYWREIFTRRDISSRWLVGRLNEHIAAGRIKGLHQKHSSTARGWILDVDVVVEWLGRIRTEKAAHVAQGASDVSHVSGTEAKG